jgi:hypothetical protein
LLARPESGGCFKVVGAVDREVDVGIALLGEPDHAPDQVVRDRPRIGTSFAWLSATPTALIAALPAPKGPVAAAGELLALDQCEEGFSITFQGGVWRTGPIALPPALLD